MRKFSANDKCMKCRYYFKKFIAFLFSHVGLCGLVVAYVILGAITFSRLEVGNERKVKERVLNLHNETVQNLWNITHVQPVGDLYVEESPQTNVLLDLASSRTLKRIQLDKARKAAAQDLWNITLEMNVLFEKNWTHLVNERILLYQNQMLDILLNESLAVADLSNHSVSVNIQSDYNEFENRVKDNLRTQLRHYEKKILEEVRQRGYDGDAETDAVQWSVAGGLLYSLTVITTIGYGHIAPKTVWGKLITMLYAIMGIPLMLLCLANIGDALAHAFKFFYWKVCCLYCEIKKRRRRLMRIQSVRMSRKSNRSPAMSNNIAGMNSMHSSFKAKPPTSILEKPTELRLPNAHNTLIRISSTPSPTPDDRRSEDISGATTELATTSNDQSSEMQNNNNNNNTTQISITNADPERPPMARDEEDGDGEGNEEKLMIIIPGQDRRKMSVCNMPPETIDGIDYVDETPQPSPTHLSPDETTAVIVHDVTDDDDDQIRDFEPRYEKVSVPVYVCLLVVFGYIVGGSILFGTWEGWDYLDGAYFCFITLTTIGFGDFVPGVSSSGENTSNSEEKLTLCSLYLVFGMALLAMSFNLVQEAVTEKAKWLARKIGILSDDSEEED